MEDGTNNLEPSWPQSARTRAYAAAEPGHCRTFAPAISQDHNQWSSVSTSFVDQQLGDSNNLSRSAFAENNRISLVDYDHYNAYESVVTPGNFTRAKPWGPSSPNDHAFGPFTSSNTLQLTGNTSAGFAADVADNDATALPTALDPYTWGAAAPTVRSNNQTFNHFINSNPPSLTGSISAANAAYDGGITYLTVPSPYSLGAAAPPGLIDHYMGPGLQYPHPAFPMMDPFAADTNGSGYPIQFPATSSNTQLGTTLDPPTASHATHNNEAAPLVLAEPRPTCAICNRSFSRQADLDRHAKKHRTDGKVFRCECGYSSYWKDKLDEHVRRSGHRVVGAAGVALNGV